MKMDSLAGLISNVLRSRPGPGGLGCRGRAGVDGGRKPRAAAGDWQKEQRKTTSRDLEKAFICNKLCKPSPAECRMRK